MPLHGCLDIGKRHLTECARQARLGTRELGRPNKPPKKQQNCHTAIRFTLAMNVSINIAKINGARLGSCEFGRHVLHHCVPQLNLAFIPKFQSVTSPMVSRFDR